MERRGLQENVRTVLVHRATRGPAPWWYSSAIFDPDRPLDSSDPERLLEFASLARAAGFDALVLSPSPEDVDSAGTPVPGLVARLHELGLRVVVALPADAFADLDDPDVDAVDRESLVLARTRLILEAGADGIDLGECGEYRSSRNPDRSTALARERFAALVRLVESEAMAADSQPIVIGRITGADASHVRAHLEEDWFHQLRDDALRRVAWDARSIENAVVSSLESRDRLGAITPWSVDVACAEPGGGLALALYALSLPGAAHVLFGPDALASDIGALPIDEVVPLALSVRSSKGLGTGSLGIVHGLAWAAPGVVVHLNGPVMVVLNTSEQPVSVPGRAPRLCSSHALGTAADGSTIVPAGACAWFETPRIRPAAAAYWD